MERIEGTFVGLYVQVTKTISLATGNDVYVNPYDDRSIERAALKFGDNNSGTYPDIDPIAGGGFTYTTISGRKLHVYPEEGRWVLDCSEWWDSSENFRSTVENCWGAFLDITEESIPDPEPEHTHAGDEIIGQEFTLEHTPVNNHGCSGFWVKVKATSPTTGTVIDGQSYSSSYNVGHNPSESPISIGSEVQLPEDFCWVCASESDPDWMSSRDTSRNSSTKVAPYDLIVLQEACTVSE